MCRTCHLLLQAVVVCLFPGASAPAAEGSPELLKNGGFEETEGELPRGWTLSLGARSGNSTKTNEVQVETGGASGGRVVRLRGADDTSIWNSLGQNVPVTPGQTLRVTGRSKTKDVQARRYTSCNLIVIFETGREGEKPVTVLGTKPRLGTNDWQALSLRAEVPPGSTRARIGCFLSCSGTAWFDDLSARIVEPAKWTKRSGAIYDMYSLDPKNSPTQQDLLANEAACRKAAGILGVEIRSRISYYVYPYITTKEEFTGNTANANVAPGKPEIHSIFRGDAHEIVHLLTREWGNPPAILGEGIAVYLAGPWHGKPNRKWVREFLTSNRYVTLGDILDTRRFRAADDLITYPECGAFVEFLVEKYGWPKVRKLYSAAKADGSAADFGRAFREACGEDFTSAETRFKSWTESKTGA